MNRKAFTMIELVFVLVIIGILAAVAIPRLNATRMDALIARELGNLKICIQDAGAAYTATGTEDVSSSSCSALKCYRAKMIGGSITNTATDGIYYINYDPALDPDIVNSPLCVKAREVAERKDLPQTYFFGAEKDNTNAGAVVY